VIDDFVGKLVLQFVDQIKVGSYFQTRWVL